MRWICLVLLSGSALADDWPQWMGPKRDNIWRETGIVRELPVGGPRVVWRAKVAGGYSGPAVANGKLYVGDFVSNVDPKGEVYTRTNHRGTERVLCFDAETGKQLWAHEYPCQYTVSFPNGPRTTPCVNDGRVYFVGTEGDFRCLDANTGRLLWQKNYRTDYGGKTPIWGYAGHAVVEGDTVFGIPGGPEACVVALDKVTGKERWKKLTAADPGYSAPAVVEFAGKKQLLVWHGESLNGLDIATGERLWNVPLKASNGSAIMVPVTDGKYLLAAGFSHVGKGMQLKTDKPGVDVLWTSDRKSGLYPVNAQPFLLDGHAYGVCQNGELRCVDLATGKRLWETLDHLGGKGGQCATAFLIRHEDRFILFNDKGELIFARLSTKGYEETSRARIIDPTGHAMGRDVVYCAPAFAQRRLFVRNDRELICVSLAAE